MDTPHPRYARNTGGGVGGGGVVPEGAEADPAHRGQPACRPASTLCFLVSGHGRFLDTLFFLHKHTLLLPGYTLLLPGHTLLLHGRTLLVVRHTCMLPRHS